jgi:hypothetical protein
MPGQYDRGAAVLLQASHRSQPRLQSAMVSLNPIVAMLLSGVPGRRQQLVEHHRVDRRSVGDDLDEWQDRLSWWS